MKLWHVPDLHSDDAPDDGWYVIAETADDARALVKAHRDAEWRKAKAEETVPWAKGLADDQYRVWYATGHIKEGTPDPDTHLGEPEEVTGGVARIPFLGYSW